LTQWILDSNSILFGFSSSSEYQCVLENLKSSSYKCRSITPSRYLSIYSNHFSAISAIFCIHFYTPAPPEGGILFYLCSSVRPSVRPRYCSSHLSQELLMAEIWYLVTSFI
jgi:hypothetical protein